MTYVMTLPKRRTAYQYCVLQYYGNLKFEEYENAIAEYEERINRLKQRIILEKLPDEHFYYQQIKWMQGNRVELLRKTAPYLFKGYVEPTEEGDEEEKQYGYQDYSKEVFDFVETF